LSSISNMLSPQLYAWLFAFFTSKSAPIYYPGVPFAMAAFAYSVYFALIQGLSEEVFPWVSKGKCVSKNRTVAPQEENTAPLGANLLSSNRTLSGGRLAVSKLIM
jgi:hypothetical protein